MHFPCAGTQRVLGEHVANWGLCLDNGCRSSSETLFMLFHLLAAGVHVHMPSPPRAGLQCGGAQ